MLEYRFSSAVVEVFVIHLINSEERREIRNGSEGIVFFLRSHVFFQRDGKVANYRNQSCVFFFGKNLTESTPQKTVTFVRLLYVAHTYYRCVETIMGAEKRSQLLLREVNGLYGVCLVTG